MLIQAIEFSQFEQTILSRRHFITSSFYHDVILHSTLTNNWYFKFTILIPPLILSNYYYPTRNSFPTAQDSNFSGTSANARFCLPCYKFTIKILFFILISILLLILFLILFFMKTIILSDLLSRFCLQPYCILKIKLCFDLISNLDLKGGGISTGQFD